MVLSIRVYLYYDTIKLWAVVYHLELSQAIFNIRKKEVYFCCIVARGSKLVLVLDNKVRYCQEGWRRMLLGLDNWEIH